MPSQTKMAAIVGIHQTAWSLYERGERAPDQFEMPRLVGKLGISLPYLLHGSLDGVRRDMAIRLAALHPELAPPVDIHPDMGTGQT